MSDEPKKRSQAWIWTRRVGWAVLALLVLYPLSAGPAHWFAMWSDAGNDLAYRTFNLVYRPLWWVGEQSETLEDWINSYVCLDLWMP